MQPIRSLGHWLDRWADRLACAAGAFVAAQAPSFMLQYVQRLGGHLDEARRQLAILVSAAEKSGRPWREWAESARANSDAAVAELGKVIIDSDARVTSLQQAHHALVSASVFERPFVFLRHVDSQVFSGTWTDYAPTVPTTFEGAVYAVVGMAIGLAIYSLATVPVKRRFARPVTA